MRIPTPVRLLLAPAALLAAACDDTTSPNEPFEVDERHRGSCRDRTSGGRGTLGRWVSAGGPSDHPLLPAESNFSYNRSGGPITHEVAGATGRYIVRFTASPPCSARRTPCA